MALQLTIPDSVLQELRLPEPYQAQELLKELAIALYSQEALCFNKASELAQMNHQQFGKLLHKRCVNRHCGRVSIDRDLACTYSE
jgi:predicted HTH domain antitoxin